jgi:hypothetical protein
MKSSSQEPIAPTTAAFLGQNRELAGAIKTEFQRSQSFTFGGSWTSLRELFGLGGCNLPHVVLLNIKGLATELTRRDNG